MTPRSIAGAALALVLAIRGDDALHELVADILKDVKGVEFVRFGGEDVVRHRLVQRIVEAYDEHASTLAPGLRPANVPRRRA